MARVLSGMKRGLWPAFLCLVLFLATGEPAQGDEDATTRAHARTAKTIARDLERLFKQAKESDLDLRAMELARVLVHFDADHKDARAWLGDVRGDDAWEAPEEAPERLDSNPEALEKFTRRQKSKIAELSRRLWRMHDKLEGGKHAEARDFLLEDIAALDPNDLRLEEVRTVMLKDGFWLTSEMVRTKLTDDKIREMHLAPWKDHPKEKAIELHPRLKKTPGVPWNQKVKVGHVSVWGVCPPGEASYMGRCGIAAAQILEYCLTGPLPPMEDIGFVVLEDQEARVTFAREVGLPHNARMGSYMIPGLPIFVTARFHNARVRVDSGIRQLATVVYEQRFGSKAPWMTQGAGLALTFLATRTRLSMMGRRPASVDAEEARLTRVLFDDKSSWNVEAMHLINKGSLPTIAMLAPQSTNEIWVREALSCYAHAMYLLLAYPDEASMIFHRLSSGHPAETVFAEELGWESLDVVHAKLKRYLNDSTPYEEGVSERRKASGPIPRVKK